MKKAFTLIELLIVVAIIAILAAIAVPNFLEAQTRAKVSRAKADMRTMATALETYAVDENKYPFCFQNAYPCDNTGDWTQRILERLSSPTAYLTNSLLPDPFKPNTRRATFTAPDYQGSSVTPVNLNQQPVREHFIKYIVWSQGTGLVDYARITNPTNGVSPKTFCIYTGGPQNYYPGLGTVLRGAANVPEGCAAQMYDPTNGTVSYGAIYRVGGGAVNRGPDDPGFATYGGYFYDAVSVANK